MVAVQAIERDWGQLDTSDFDALYTRSNCYRTLLSDGGLKVQCSGGNPALWYPIDHCVVRYGGKDRFVPILAAFELRIDEYTGENFFGIENPSDTNDYVIFSYNNGSLYLKFFGTTTGVTVNWSPEEINLYEILMKCMKFGSSYTYEAVFRVNQKIVHRFDRLKTTTYTFDTVRPVYKVNQYGVSDPYIAMYSSRLVV